MRATARYSAAGSGSSEFERIWAGRLNEDDLELLTIQWQLRTLRVFLGHCGSLGPSGWPSLSVTRWYVTLKRTHSLWPVMADKDKGAVRDAARRGEAIITFVPNHDAEELEQHVDPEVITGDRGSLLANDLYQRNGNLVITTEQASGLLLLELDRQTLKSQPGGTIIGTECKVRATDPELGAERRRR